MLVRLRSAAPWPSNDLKGRPPPLLLLLLGALYHSARLVIDMAGQSVLLRSTHHDTDRSTVRCRPHATSTRRSCSVLTLALSISRERLSTCPRRVNPTSSVRLHGTAAEAVGPSVVTSGGTVGRFGRAHGPLTSLRLSALVNGAGGEGDRASLRVGRAF